MAAQKKTHQQQAQEDLAAAIVLVAKARDLLEWQAQNPALNWGERGSFQHYAQQLGVLLLCDQGEGGMCAWQRRYLNKTV